MMNLNTAIISGAAQTTGVALDVIQMIADQQMKNFQLQKELGQSETKLSCNLGSAIRDSEIDEAYNSFAGGAASLAGATSQFVGEGVGLYKSAQFTKEQAPQNAKISALEQHQELIKEIPQNEEGTSKVAGPNSKADKLNDKTIEYLEKHKATDKLSDIEKEILKGHLTEAKKANSGEFDAFSKRVDDEHTRLTKERTRGEEKLDQTRRTASNLGSAANTLFNGLGQITGNAAFKLDQADQDLKKQYTQAVFDMTKRMNDQSGQTNGTLQSTKDSLINQVLSNRSEVAA